MRIDSLKNLNPGNLDVEALLAASADLTNLKSSFTAHAVDVPEWLEDKQREVSREINEKLHADRKARLEKLKARRNALATAEEKRSALDAEIAALEALETV